MGWMKAGINKGETNSGRNEKVIICFSVQDKGSEENGEHYQERSEEKRMNGGTKERKDGKRIYWNVKICQPTRNCFVLHD